MTACYFGDSRAQLFGVYTPAQHLPAGPRSRGVIVCAPFGQEALRAHRSLRHLSSLLAAAGLHVLRFDYHATGDSAGDSGEADIDHWCADIRTAIAELKDMAGITRVDLVGLRLGATLAAWVAARMDVETGDEHVAVDRLVLWDPILSGADYLRELMQDGVLDGDGPSDVDGFPLPGPMRQGLARLDVDAALDRFAGRVLILRSTPASTPATGGGHAGVRGDGDRRVVECMPGEAAWHEQRGLGVGAIPVPLLQRIVEWSAA